MSIIVFSAVFVRVMVLQLQNCSLWILRLDKICGLENYVSGLAGWNLVTFACQPIGLHNLASD